MSNYQDFFKDKKVTVMGLGLLGRGIGDIKFLAECGAELTVTDLKAADRLASSIQELDEFTARRQLPAIRYVLGEHRLEDFQNCDLVIKAAGVPLDSVYVAEAKKQGIRVAMSTELFAELSGTKIIGITGTRGKSTTTYLIYEILKAAGYRTLLGGNIRGVSTLALLSQVQPGDWAVLELDSWQLQGFGESRLSPHIAVFTNFLPDHLNYYKNDLDLYFADKANIFKYQKPSDYLVCSRQIAERLGVPAAPSLPTDWAVGIPGEHNRINAGLAAEAARLAGVSQEIIRQVISEFRGAPGRLEMVKTIRGIKIYNDTNSTTPDALAVALKTLGQRQNIILIMGGADKGLDFTQVMPLLESACKKIILLPGTGTDSFLSAQLSSSPCLKAKTLQSATLAEAVNLAMSHADAGEVVLLSPGFASFGLFLNEYDRGDQFNKLVSVLQ